MIWTFNFLNWIVMSTETIRNCCIFILLFTTFLSWDNWTKIFGKFDTLSTLNWQKWKVVNWFQCQFEIWKTLAIWILKIQLFEFLKYLIWYYIQKNVEFKCKFGSDNWISFFNLVIWIDFVKMNGTARLCLVPK